MFRKKEKGKKNIGTGKIKEIPIKLTIIDCVETPETGHVAHCILNIDDKEEISFKFGLTGDSPQDITNFLV